VGDSGGAAGPVRLWWARRDGGGEPRSVEISGLPYGTESNPPAWDPVNRIVVAYDAGNAVIAAWRLIGDDLEPLWKREGFAHARHLHVPPDPRELTPPHWPHQPPSAPPQTKRMAFPATTPPPPPGRLVGG